MERLNIMSHPIPAQDYSDKHREETYKEYDERAKSSKAKAFDKAKYSSGDKAIEKEVEVFEKRFRTGKIKSDALNKAKK